MGSALRKGMSEVVAGRNSTAVVHCRIADSREAEVADIDMPVAEAVQAGSTTPTNSFAQISPLLPEAAAANNTALPLVQHHPDTPPAHDNTLPHLQSTVIRPLHRHSNSAGTDSRDNRPTLAEAAVEESVSATGSAYAIRRFLLPALPRILVGNNLRRIPRLRAVLMHTAADTDLTEEG